MFAAALSFSLLCVFFILLLFACRNRRCRCCERDGTGKGKAPPAAKPTNASGTGATSDAAPTAPAFAKVV